MAKSTDGWKIVSHWAMGPIQFGFTRDNVRTVLGVKPTTFQKTPDSTSLTDAFVLGGKKVRVRLDVGTDVNTTAGGHHVHVYYDANDRCEFVEVSLSKGGSPGGPELDGRGFLNRPYDRALAWARDRDPALLVDRSGFYSGPLGIAVYASEERIESLSAFTAEYFENYRKLFAAKPP